MLKIDKKSYKDVDVYYIGHKTKQKIDDCGNICSVNLLYLSIDHANGYIEVDNSDFDYEKDCMIMKCISDDNLRLNKPLKFHDITITIRCVFE